MTNPREQPLSETDILKELEPFAKFRKAYRAGKRGTDLPKLPKNPKNPTEAAFWPFAIDLALHPFLAVLTTIARRVHAHRLLSLVAKVRLTSDRLSSEPRACGLNSAYTNLGLALLAQNDIAGAIHCLDASWRVHPCPHNTTYGLQNQLALALHPYPEAHPSLEQYNRMNRRFLSDGP
jgi:hypothetical protein